MSDADSSQRRAALAGCAAIAALGAARMALFLGAPPDAQIALIPDDAFYYFVPARNFAQLGAWTFDGHAPATGFHLLYGYLLAGLFRLAPGISDAALFAGLTAASTALLAASAYLVARAAARDFGAAAALGVALAFAAPIALQQQTLFVESPLVIFFASALLALLSRAGEVTHPSTRWLGGALALGLLGSLARSDFGLFGACCAIALGTLGRSSERARGQAALAATATLGSAAGVAAVSLHTWVWSGSVIQSSARMKSHWGALRGYDLRGLARYLVDLVYPRSTWLGARFAAPLLLGAGLFGAVTRLRARLVPLERLPLAAGCALAVAGYALLYGRASGGVPPWYLANVLAPLAYLFGGVTSFTPARAVAPAIAVAALCAAFNVAASLQPIWPNQVAMRAAGEYLRSHPEVEPVGAWNAGMISHFARRPVVNLDGLVNDDVYAYATTGRLLDYVCRRGLRFVLDFSDNVERPELAERGGYADGRLRSFLREAENFSNGEPSRQWAGSDLKLYRLDAGACPAE